MQHESIQRVERIKQQIDVYKEDIKFLNSFFLPLLSGIVALFATKNVFFMRFRAYWTAGAFIALFFLNLLKKKVGVKIDKLIREIK